jgi:hypothetical protein
MEGRPTQRRVLERASVMSARKCVVNDAFDFLQGV